MIYELSDPLRAAPVRLAEKLGYEYSREYICYGVD